MDPKLFESLLHEDESATLDFKRDQYRFSQATDDQRAELLKDIVGFANAWRRTEAYLLVGVQHVRGGRSTVTGVTEHLPDHSLQQFVTNALDRPLQFAYEAFTHEGKKVGIIRIGVQHRPFRLSRNIGKLEKGCVYVRRGSSTDPTKPASVDEIAEMTAADSSTIEQATLSVQFAHLDRDEPSGTEIHWEAEFCEMPDLQAVPDFGEESGSDSRFSLIVRDPLRRTNHDYYRDFAYFTQMRALLRPVRLVAQNTGAVPATDVRIELRVRVSPGVVVVDASGLPEEPQPVTYGVPTIGRGLALRREPGDVEVAKDNHHFKVDVECGNLQPRRRVWSEVFYIGTTLDEPLIISGQSYAANLSQPHDVTLSITVSLAHRKFTVEDVIAAADKARTDG